MIENINLHETQFNLTVKPVGTETTNSPNPDDVALFHQQLFQPIENFFNYSSEDIGLKSSDGPASSGFWRSDRHPSLEYVNEGAGSPFVAPPALGPATVEHIMPSLSLEFFAFDF